MITTTDIAEKFSSPTSTSDLKVLDLTESSVVLKSSTSNRVVLISTVPATSSNAYVYQLTSAGPGVLRTASRTNRQDWSRLIRHLNSHLVLDPNGE